MKPEDWLIVTTIPVHRERAIDMANAILGPPGSVMWSLLPKSESGWTATYAIPEDPSKVLVAVPLRDDHEIAPGALEELRKRASEFGGRNGISKVDVTIGPYPSAPYPRLEERRLAALAMLGRLVSSVAKHWLNVASYAFQRGDNLEEHDEEVKALADESERLQSAFIGARVFVDESFRDHLVELERKLSGFTLTLQKTLRDRSGGDKGVLDRGDQRAALFDDVRTSLPSLVEVIEGRIHDVIETDALRA